MALASPCLSTSTREIAFQRANSTQEGSRSSPFAYTMSINFPVGLALMSRSIAPASTKVAFLAKTEFAQTVPAMLAVAAANKMGLGRPTQLSNGTIPMQRKEPPARTSPQKLVIKLYSWDEK